MACGGEQAELLDDGVETQAPIINGNTDNGDPAVVALTISGFAFCTGTLITPTVVLTAAHCLPPNIPEITHNAAQIDVFFGTSVGNGEFVDVSEGWAHPAWNIDNFYDDVGLLRLQTASPVAPIPLNTGGNFGNNTPFRVVGFRINSENGSDSGLKREGVAFLDQFDGQALILGPNPSATCSGDSGGPSLLSLNGTEHVAGIHSRANCQGASIETRVDAYLSAINNFTSTGPGCGSDGQSARHEVTRFMGLTESHTLV